MLSSPWSIVKMCSNRQFQRTKTMTTTLFVVKQMAHRTTLLKWMTKLKLKRWQWWINHQQVIWLNIYWTHCPCPFKLALTKWMLIVSKAKVYLRFIISLSGDFSLSLSNGCIIHLNLIYRLNDISCVWVFIRNDRA